jgi:hypothetical protein
MDGSILGVAGEYPDEREASGGARVVTDVSMLEA